MTLGSGVILDLYGGVSGSTVWADHSIHGNDGVLDSADMRVLAPNDLEVMEFSSGQNANCGNDVSLDVTLAATFICWAKTTATLTYQQMIGRYNGVGNNRSYLFRISNTDVFQFAWSNDGANVSYATSTTPLSTSVWYLFVATIEGTSVNQYINGEFDKNTVGLNGLFVPTTVELGIGSERGGGSGSWNGQLYRPRMLSYALSEPQVGELHEQEELWFR